ncbi:MAG: hypothetical protein ABIQ86_00815 [Steroidobacteraceae bacterium]
MLAGIASLISFPALAACTLPPAPPVSPSGATAGREEMLTAQASLKAYNDAVVVYGDCVQKAGGSVAEFERTVKQLKLLAAQFNAELRIFKQKSGAK